MSTTPTTSWPTATRRSPMRSSGARNLPEGDQAGRLRCLRRRRQPPPFRTKRLVTAVGRGAPFPDAEKHRAAYAELAEKHLICPSPKRTRIFGTVPSPVRKGEGIEIHHPWPSLSVGYGGGPNHDRPGIWRGHHAGTPGGRADPAGEMLVGQHLDRRRMAAMVARWRGNPAEKARAKMEQGAGRAGEKRRPRVHPAPRAHGHRRPRLVLELAMPQMDKVLADPGKYYPGYDPKVGYEVAGLVWFQGYSDLDNPAYGELLAQMIRDFREKVNDPEHAGGVRHPGHGRFQERRRLRQRGSTPACSRPPNAGIRRHGRCGQHRPVLSPGIRSAHPGPEFLPKKAPRSTRRPC
jgi:hypothetical protein